MSAPDEEARPELVNDAREGRMPGRVERAGGPQGPRPGIEQIDEALDLGQVGMARHEGVAGVAAGLLLCLPSDQQFVRAGRNRIELPRQADTR
jgi:hypothetical protein